jgi:protein-disulfide isomerase
MRKIWNFAARCLVFSGIAIGLVTGVASPASQALAQGSAPKATATFADMKITADDHVMGRADAPVTIVEYASLTCPHCANFHKNELPGLKKSYIETGKVRLIYRDFPLDRLALAGSILARCFERDRYFPFIGILFNDQNRWARSADPMKSLGQIARLGGLSPEKFSACFKDKAIQTSVLEQRLLGAKSFKINSTPTLFVNGRKFDGGLTFDQLKTVIDPLLPKN